MSNLTEALVKKISDKAAVAKAFSAAANTYDSAAFLQREIGDRLIQRLESCKEIQTEQNIFANKAILDLGSGTGFFSRALEQKFSNTHIVNLDIAYTMLVTAKLRISKHANSGSHHSYLCADAESVPLQPNTFDLIFSNCTIQWCEDYVGLFAAIQKLLKPNGVFLFSTFGPDTLIELRDSFKNVDNNVHVNCFTDMHPLGDALLKAQFFYPVVDREFITLQYASVRNLLKDLKRMGSTHVRRNAGTMGLMSPAKLAQLCAAYESLRNPEGRLPASFEVIFGYALKGDSVSMCRENHIA